MKAMILAAGLGSRLGEITKTMPKCLVEVGGVTLLEHVVEQLKAVGVSSIVVNTHHFAEQVQQYLKDKKNFEIDIQLSHETDLLETGGGIFRARQHFINHGDFIVHNADVYHSLDLAALIAAHQQKLPLASLLVMKRESKRYLIFDQGQHLIGRMAASGESTLAHDAPVQELYAFSGIQIISPRLFPYLEGFPEKFSIIDGYLKAVAAGATVKGVLMEGDWSDIGTPERLLSLQSSF
jgi:NDP-sugar pyrophosphorylase family protein